MMITIEIKYGAFRIIKSLFGFDFFKYVLNSNEYWILRHIRTNIYCSLILCFNIIVIFSSVCSTDGDCGDHGMCNTTDHTCSCTDGYSGNKCQIQSSKCFD